MAGLGIGSRASAAAASAAVAMMTGLHPYRAPGQQVSGGEADVCARMEVPGYPGVIIEAKTVAGHTGLVEVQKGPENAGKAPCAEGEADERALVTRQSREVMLRARIVPDWKTQTVWQWLCATFLLRTGTAEAINEAVQKELAAKRDASAMATRKAVDELGALIEARNSGQLDEPLERRREAAPRAAREPLQARETTSMRSHRAALERTGAFSSALGAMAKAATEFHGCRTIESADPRQRWLDEGGEFAPADMFVYRDQARVNLPVEPHLYIRWSDVVETPDSPTMAGIRDLPKYRMGQLLQAAQRRQPDASFLPDNWKKTGRIPATAVRDVSRLGAMAGMDNVRVHDPSHPERELFMKDGKLCDVFPMATLNGKGQEAVFGMVDGQIDYVERAASYTDGGDSFKRQDEVSKALSTDPGITGWFFDKVTSGIRLDGTGRTLRDMIPAEELRRLRDTYVARRCPNVLQADAQVVET